MLGKLSQEHWKGFLFFVVWFQVVHVIYCEVFSSIADLEHLVRKERYVTSLLETAIDNGWEPQEEMARIRDVFATHWVPKNASMLDPAEHPVDAFILIKYWARLNEKINDTQPTLKDQLTSMKDVVWPTKNDYIGSVMGLLRLQKTYLISSAELASGTISGYLSRTRLEADDFYSLGKEAAKSDHNVALTWFTEAIKRKHELDNDTLAQLYMQMSTIYEKARNYKKAAEMAKEASSVVPSKANAFQERRMTSLVASNRPINPYWVGPVLPVTKQYEALCRGDGISNDIRVTKDLVCVYRQSSSVPYMRYKEEIHSFDTRVSLFLDVISPTEADRVRRLAYPAMARAGVGDPHHPEAHLGRVSKTSWLFDEDPMIVKLSKRIKDITGLETRIAARLSSSEAFQVVSYGVGGQYEPHYDYFTDKLLQHLPTYIHSTGDRLATFLFYLSDAKEGGATVFPQLGVRVPPVQYGAAFWYNIKLSGEKDTRTNHAGCPILLGQKWVTNKWIREYGQEFRRKCATSRTAIDPLLPSRDM